MDKLSRKKEGKKELRSKRLLTEAFFELLNEQPGESISIKDLCERADYARPTFYAHFNQIQDVPYYYYKENWLNNYVNGFINLHKQGIAIKETLFQLIETYYSYWANQVESYRLLKSIEMDCVLLRLLVEATQVFYETYHPSPDFDVNSISGKCLIKGQAQLSLSIYDIWAYSGRRMDAKEMASILYKIMDGTSGLSENLNKTNL